MAQFEFPLTEEQFLKALTPEGAKLIASVLKADAKFGFSCMKLGWTNKMFHKKKQDRDREELRRVRALMKEDPSIAKKMGVKS
jgi:hypothetical protein